MVMTEYSLAAVLSAVQALYNMEGAGRQREANEFLNTFAASDAAWSIGCQLLLDEMLVLPLEALFFAANMLHTKIRKEWVQLSVETKEAIHVSLQTLMQALQDRTRSDLVHGPLVSKLCASYAVVMISSPEECKSLFSHLLTTCSTTGNTEQVVFLLVFARCVCEEMENAELPFAAKDAMEMHLASLSGDLVTLIGKIVCTREDLDVHVASLHGEALTCLNIWTRPAGLSLASLYSKDKTILLALLNALQTKSRHLRASSEILTKLIIVSSYPTPAQLEQTLLVVAQELLKTRAAIESAIDAEEEDACHALADVISTFCETFADWILEGKHPQEAIALGELMLYLGSHPRRQIASLTLEFWMIVQDEPVHSRLHFYQHDAFIRLFEVVLKQCSFPPGNVEDVGEFEIDDLNAFRSDIHGAPDAFIAIFSLLKEQYLSRLVHVLTSAASSEWQSVEVALFAISSVAGEVKKKLTKAYANTPMQIELESMISQIFRVVLDPAANTHPLVIATAARLLGQFAGWINDRALAAHTFETVGAVLQYLSDALGLRPSRANAAKSFMQVSTSCMACLAEMPPSLLVAGAQHFGGTFGREPMPIEERLLVVEGLVRAAAVSPNCSVILQTVLDDSLSRVDQALVAKETNGAALYIIVCNELQVLGKLMRFLDAPEDTAGGKAVTAWAAQQIWPHLNPIALQFDVDEAIMAALFELFGWCLQSLRQQMASQLDGIATLIVRVFEKRHYAAPLECAIVALDVFGKEANAEVAGSFRGLLGALSRSAFQFFTTHSLAEKPKVLQSFFELGYRFLLSCPAAVLTAAEFPVLIELGLACLGNQDRASTNAVLVFLTFLLNEYTTRLAPYTAVINACVLDAGQPEKWLDGIIGALALKSPSTLYESMAKLLYALLTNFTGNTHVREALVRSLTRDALGVGGLGPEDRQQVLHLWLSLTAQPSHYSERRFRGLCSDFAKVCRKELTADALHSIEMPN